MKKITKAGIAVAAVAAVATSAMVIVKLIRWKTLQIR